LINIAENIDGNAELSYISCVGDFLLYFGYNKVWVHEAFLKFTDLVSRDVLLIEVLEVVDELWDIHNKLLSGRPICFGSAHEHTDSFEDHAHNCGWVAHRFECFQLVFIYVLQRFL